ncbi:MAG: hypothetical protein KBD53_10550 [Candidatus Omnitrophica bacterium]|nr:hypothetical protein [Candidatus Omnitrophota bacterium]
MSKKIVSALLIIPLFSVITFCCCLENNADASNEHEAMGHHQELEKSDHHSEKNQHQHSEGQDECSCPKHFSFLSEQPVDIISNLSSFYSLAKSLTVHAFEVSLSTVSFQALGPPGQDHRDYTSIPLFLKNSNLRI